MKKINSEREAIQYADMILCSLEQACEREFYLATEKFEYLSDYKQYIATRLLGLENMQNGCPLCHFYDNSPACILDIGEGDDCCDGACHKKLSYQSVVDAFNDCDYHAFISAVGKFKMEVREICQNK